MRGSDARSGELFSYVDLEDRVPAAHPLRKIRQLVNEVLLSLDGEFAKAYSAFGRESIPPERLLRALLLQALFSVRSERQLMEQLNYNLLFRWFVGLGIDDPVWVPTVFSKNRARLLDADFAKKFMSQLLAHKEVRGLLSDDHFSVDAPCRLPGQPAQRKADRGSLRLVQNNRHRGQNHAARPGKGWIPVHTEHGRLQSRLPAQALCRLRLAKAKHRDR